MDSAKWWEFFGWFLAVLVVVGAPIGLYFPVKAAMDAATDSSCRCRYCSLYTDLSVYHSTHKSFPSSTAKNNGIPCSWRVLLAMRSSYFGKYDETLPWNAPQNLALQDDLGGHQFRCPWQSPHGSETPFTNYVAVVGPHTAFRPTAPVTWKDITDGKENTGLLCEVLPSTIHWMEPRDPTVPELIQLLDANAGTGHFKGPGIMFADGQVFRIAKKIPDAVLEAIFTIDRADGLTREELIKQGYLH